MVISSLSTGARFRVQINDEHTPKWYKGTVVIQKSDKTVVKLDDYKIIGLKYLEHETEIEELKE